MKSINDFLRRVQSPIDAALHMYYDIQSYGSPENPSRSKLVLYLLQHGVAIPLAAARCAIVDADTELLSVLLEAQVPMSAEIYGSFTIASDKPNETEEDLERRVRFAMAVLDNGIEVTNADAINAIKLGDLDLVKRILSHNLRQVQTEGTILEAAIVGGNPFIIQEALKHESTRYSAHALCAATFQTVTGLINPDIVSHILELRHPNSISQGSLELETTAIGIAACYKSFEILELLLASVPVFDFAYIPTIYHYCMDMEDREDRGSPEPQSMQEAIVYTDDQWDTFRPWGFWHGSFNSSSVLVYAIESTPPILLKLLDHGYKFDWTAVASILYQGKGEQYMKYVLDQSTLIHGDYGPNTALRLAIDSGDITLMKSLLKFCDPPGYDIIGLGDHDGPLQVTIKNGNLEMFDALLEVGINPDTPAEANRGMTALQAAAIYNRVGLAKRLIDLKVDVNAPGATEYGRTALEGAAEHGHIDMIELLLHSGVITTGPGQRQFLRAIRFAQRECHFVAADMLKRHRKLNEEDLSILEEKDLLREYALSPSDSTSSCSDCTSEDERRSDDEANSVSEEVQAGEDLTQLDTENTILSEERSDQLFRISEDETLLADSEVCGDSMDFFSDDFRFKHDPNPVLDISAPSDGIYNFDYPLFDVHDVHSEAEDP
ncbi:hypothetical protein RRF57_004663 [Xylaria bambusicola]|uniref:Ankyrin n=1 Tax=Xylaria bambusicola TaxID=326684 RepID=A0AAN7UGT5_9PEZI